MADVSDPRIQETYDEIRRPGAETNWMLLGYEGNRKIVFQAKGTGGIDEMKAQLVDNMPAYGYLRVPYVQPGDDVTERTKFVFFAWGPERVRPMLKGQMSVHQAAVKEILKDWSISIQASLPEEITTEVVQRKLERSSY